MSDEQNKAPMTRALLEYGRVHAIAAGAGQRAWRPSSAINVLPESHVPRTVVVQRTGQPQSQYVAGWTLLAASPAQRGTGVGRVLLRFAEELSVAMGLRVMQ